MTVGGKWEKKKLVVGRGFGRPELAGSWEHIVLGQETGLVPSRRLKGSSLVGLERVRFAIEHRAG